MTTQSSPTIDNQRCDKTEPSEESVRQLRRLTAAGYVRDDKLPELEDVARQFSVSSKVSMTILRP